MLIPQLGAIDWIVLAVLAGSLFLGAWRGFVFEVLSLMSWIVAVIVAQIFASPVSAALPMGAASDSVRYAVGFVVVFIVIIFSCNLVAAVIRRLVNAAGLRPVDRVLGALFGVIRAGVLGLVVGFLAEITAVGSTAWWKDSLSGPVLTAGVQSLRPVLPDRIAGLLEMACCSLSQAGKPGALLPVDPGLLRNWGN